MIATKERKGKYMHDSRASFVMSGRMGVKDSLEILAPRTTHYLS